MGQTARLQRHCGWHWRCCWWHQLVEPQRDGGSWGLAHPVLPGFVLSASGWRRLQANLHDVRLRNAVMKYLQRGTTTAESYCCVYPFFVTEFRPPALVVPIAANTPLQHKCVSPDQALVGHVRRPVGEGAVPFR